MRKFRIGWYCLGVVLIGLTAACPPTRPPPVSATLNETFWLRYGQTASIEGEDLSITFSQVLADSRCPEDVVCIWPGEVNLVFAVVAASAKAVDLMFDVGPGGDIEQLGAHAIRVTEVAPPRFAEQSISASEYRVRVTVQSSAP